MKGPVVLFVIALSLAVAALLQSNKNNAAKDDIDRIALALQGIKPIVPTGKRLYFTSEPGNTELYTQARFVLAPTLLQPIDRSITNPDTLLSIQYIFTGDTALNQYIANRNILWQHKDERYHYTLTTKK